MQQAFFDMLHQEHELVTTIIQDIEYTFPECASLIHDRLTALKRVLVPNLVAEENSLYPVIHARPELRDDAERGLDEHHEIEGLLFEINTLPVGPSEAWIDCFTRFKELVARHVRFEENTIFRDTGKVLGHAEIQEITEKYRKLKAGARENVTGVGALQPED